MATLHTRLRLVCRFLLFWIFWWPAGFIVIVGLSKVFSGPLHLAHIYAAIGASAAFVFCAGLYRWFSGTEFMRTWYPLTWRFLLAFLLVGNCGVLAFDYVRQNQFLSRAHEFGCVVAYSYEMPPLVMGIDRLFNSVAFRSTTTVVFPRGRRISGDEVQSLNIPATVTQAYFTDTDAGDDALRAIGNLKRLEILGLQGTKITDAGLQSTVPSLRSIRIVIISNTAVSLNVVRELEAEIHGLEVVR